MLALNDQNFDKNIDKYRIVLVDFWAPWCAPCKSLDPILRSITNTEKDIKVMSMNIEENPSIASSLGVKSVPTLMLFRQGSCIGSRIGFADKPTILTWVEDLLSSV